MRRHLKFVERRPSNPFQRPIQVVAQQPGRPLETAASPAIVSACQGASRRPTGPAHRCHRPAPRKVERIGREKRIAPQLADRGERCRETGVRPAGQTLSSASSAPIARPSGTTTGGQPVAIERLRARSSIRRSVRCPSTARRLAVASAPLAPRASRCDVSSARQKAPVERLVLPIVSCPRSTPWRPWPFRSPDKRRGWRRWFFGRRCQLLEQHKRIGFGQCSRRPSRRASSPSANSR